MIESNEKLMEKAILETIYHWQRSENRYCKAFQKAFKQRGDEYILKQLSENEYYSFLTAYSIRRSLPGKGKGPVTELIRDIFKKDGFAEKVNKFETNNVIIDIYCEELSNDKDKDISGGKKILSLLAKTAFLLKPEIIPLYDKYAKESLLRNDNSLIITDFKSYFTAFKAYKDKNMKELRLKVEGYKSIFEKFDEFKEFENHNDLYEFIAHRSVDKMLWMEYESHKKQNKLNK